MYACRTQARPLREPRGECAQLQTTLPGGREPDFLHFQEKFYVLIFYVVSPNIYSWQLMPTF